MEMKIPAIAITALVVIVVLAGVLMPVLDDATAKTDTFTNKDGLIYADKITNDTDVTIAWDYTSPNQLTVNDTAITIGAASFPITFAFSDTWLIRIQPGTSVQVYQTEAASATVTASVSGTTSMAISINGSEASFVVGESTTTYPVDGGLVIAPSGEYILKKSTDAAYFSEESTAYIAGYTYHPFNDTGAVVGIYSYTLDDGIEVLSVYPPSFTHTDTVNSADVDDYLSLVKLTSIVMDVSNGNDSGTITYNQFFVPVEVTAERANHFNDNENAIFAAIPIMVIVALLIAVVALVFRGRDF